MVESEPMDRLELVEKVLMANSELIRFADRKAQLLLRLVIGLFMVAFIGVPPAVVALLRYAHTGGWAFALFLAVVILYVVCSICLLMSIMKIITAIRPRLADNPDMPTNLFFQSVARMQPDEFRKMILEIGPDEALEDMVNQTYHTALVAKVKYERINEAINWMLGGGLFGIVFALILLISVGWAKDFSPRDEPAAPPVELVAPVN